MAAELQAQIPSDNVISLIANQDINNTIDSNKIAEDEMIYNLIRGNSVSGIENKTINSVYTNQSGSNVNMSSKKYTSSQVNGCELLTNLGEHDGSFAVSTKHNSVDVSYNVVNIEVSDGVPANNCSFTKSFLVKPESVALYDSHILLNISNNDGPFYSDDISNRFSTTFVSNGDYSNYHNFQKLINSSFGNLNNQNLLNCTESVSFNQTYALGQSKNSYYTLNNDGSRQANTMEPGHSLSDNYIEVINNDLNLLRESDFGTYRFQQLPPNPEVIVEEGLALKSDVLATEMPFSITRNKSVPGPYYINTLPFNESQLGFDTSEITTSIFSSFFNINTDSSYPLPGYNYKLEVIPGDAGFSFNENNFSSTSKTNDIVTMNDDGLYNNIELMENWIDKNCELVVTNGSVVLSASTNAESSNMNYMTISSGREKLQDSQISTNGEVKLNIRYPNERANIKSNSNNVLEPVIFYNKDNATQPLKVITPELKTNYNVEYYAQLCMKRPINDTRFLSHGHSAFNLIANNTIVNNNFDVNNWEFQSNYNGNSDSTEIIKIIPQKRLDSIGGLLENISDTPVNNVVSSVYIENLAYPLNLGELSGRVKFRIKQLNELSFIDDFTTSSWTITTSNSNNLFSSSSDAYSNEGYVWPNLDQSYLLSNGGIPNLYFKCEFYNNDLKDSIIIKWGENSSDYNETLILPQNEVTVNEQVAPVISSTEIPANTYTISSGPPIGSVKLIKNIITKTYSISFPLRLRLYNNIIVTTPVYTVRTTYYSLISTSTDKELARLYLKRIKVGNTTPYTTIEEEIIGNNDKMNINSVLTKDDLNELSATVNLDINNVDTVISEPKYISLFYSNDVVNLNIINDYSSVLGNIEEVQLWLQFVELNIDTGVLNTLVLNNTNGYSIKLSNNILSETDFLIQYWSHSNNEIGTYSNLSVNNNNYMDVTKGFDAINEIIWVNNTSLYTLKTTFENNGSTTVLSVYKNPDSINPVYVIKLKNSNFFATPMYISSGKTDIWRVVKTVGETSSSIFKSIDYTLDSYIDVEGYSSISPDYNLQGIALDDGVYLKKLNPADKSQAQAVNFETVYINGKINFSLKADLVSVNFVGNASNSLLEFANNGLIFSYESGSYFSKSLTFSYYRGYSRKSNVTENTTHVYTIARTKSSAEFRFYTDSHASKYSQSLDLKTTEQVLNDFKINGNLTSGNNMVGVSLAFKYTILSNTDTLIYPVFSKGENVKITISNPRSNSYNYVINSSLKQFNLYTFSGENNRYTSNGGYLEINSSRLRFFSSVVSGSWENGGKTSASKSWTLGLADSVLRIYKLDYTIGNPYNHKNSSQIYERDSRIIPSGWGGSLASLSFDTMAEGYNFANGAFKIRRIPGGPSDNSISYFVVAKPMLKFTTMISGLNCPESLPFSLSNSFALNNIKSYYLEVSNNSIYNPFSASITYNTIENSTISHTNSASNVNNIRFTEIKPNAQLYKNYGNYSLNSIGTNYTFNIKGSNATINLMSRLKTNVSTEILTTIVNNVPLSNFLDSSWQLSNQDISIENIYSNTGCNLSFIQSTTQPYLLSASNIMGVNLPNIILQIPVFFVNPTTIKLDLPLGPGTYINMYTRNIINNKVVVYKYVPVSNISPNLLDWNDYDENLLSKTAMTVKFISRSKKEFVIPDRTLKASDIEKMDDLLNKITYSSIANIEWSFDVSYNDINTAPWFSFCSLNINTLRSTLPLFFSPPNTKGHVKINVVTRNKVLLIKDKLGNVICELDHDGILRLPAASSGTYFLGNMTNNVAPSNFSGISNRSIINLKKQ